MYRIRMPRCPLFCVDAFTEEAFSGNPAGVCLLTEEAPDDWMQNLAAELNLSETAFVSARTEGVYTIRWFTPTQEIDLCGHATLASAHILYERARVTKDKPITFVMATGQTINAKSGDDGVTNIDMPSSSCHKNSSPPEELFVALGLNKDDHEAWAGGGFHLVEVADEEIITKMTPDFPMLKKAGQKGVIVTARSKNLSYDFVSRVFAPGVGIDEDPVTGSAHCVLAPYWKPKLGIGGYFRARQLSKRGGDLRVRILNDDVVRLTGHSVTVWEGIVVV